MGISAEHVQEATARMRALYGENKKITDGNYDRSLAVKCKNGTFVGRKYGDVIAFRGIPFVGRQPVGEYRWKAPVDAVPDDGQFPLRAWILFRSAPFTPRVRNACI